MENLTEIGQEKMKNLQIGIGTMSLLGGIGGVIYSNSTKGGFWRGVGFYFLGTLIVSAPLYLITLSYRNKIVAEETTENN
jgi:hypothetical protein